VSTDNVEAESRQQRKERTRQSILNTALELSTHEPMAALSLRTIAKEVGIVPTAFYRHFSSIEELGLALSELAIAALRELMAEIRLQPLSAMDPVDVAIAAILRAGEDNAPLFTFLIRERSCGPARIRDQIRHELELVTRELTTDLARLSATRNWSTDDLAGLADLLLTLVLNTFERSGSGQTPQTLGPLLKKQSQMLLVGAQNWA